jgi:hypothetical protein
MIKRLIFLSVTCISVVYSYPAFEKIIQSNHENECPFLQKIAEIETMTDTAKERIIQCLEAYVCPYLQKERHHTKRVTHSWVSTCLINHMNINCFRNMKKKSYRTKITKSSLPDPSQSRIYIPRDGSITNNIRPIGMGCVKDSSGNMMTNRDVDLYLNDSVYPVATVNSGSNGVLRYIPDILSDGSYTLEAVDQESGISIGSSTVHIKTNRPEPPVFDTPYENEEVMSNFVTISGHIKDDTYTNLTIGGRVYIYINGNEKIERRYVNYKASLDSNGYFSLDIPLLSGEYTLKAYCVDTAGNPTFLSDMRTFTVNGPL